MGVFSRTMLMLTIAWLAGLIVLFVVKSARTEPDWREKYVAEANIRRAIAYRYVDIMGGSVAERGTDKGGKENAETAMAPESLGAAPYGLPEEGGSGGSVDPLPGAKVRPQDGLLAKTVAEGAAAAGNADAAKLEAIASITEKRAAIAEAQRARRIADSKLAQVREAARMFAAEMKSYQYIIASFQQKVFNLDYEIQRIMVERDALTAELAQIQNDINRIQAQQLEMEDSLYETSKRYEKTVKVLAWYEQADPNLRRMADATGRGWLRGKVVGVGEDPRTGVVSISLGSNEGVFEGQEFTVFRNEKYLGRMRVESVRANVSVGRLLPEFRGKVVITENDSIKSAEVFGGATLRK